MNRTPRSAGLAGPGRRADRRRRGLVAPGRGGGGGWSPPDGDGDGGGSVAGSRRTGLVAARTRWGSSRDGGGGWVGSLMVFLVSWTNEQAHSRR